MQVSEMHALPSLDFPWSFVASVCVTLVTGFCAKELRQPVSQHEDGQAVDLVLCLLTSSV